MNERTNALKNYVDSIMTRPPELVCMLSPSWAKLLETVSICSGSHLLKRLGEVHYVWKDCRSLNWRGGLG